MEQQAIEAIAQCLVGICSMVCITIMVIKAINYLNQ